MNFETAKRITVPLDVLAPLAVTGFARDPELGTCESHLNPETKRDAPA